MAEDKTGATKTKGAGNSSRPTQLDMQAVRSSEQGQGASTSGQVRI